MKITDALPVWIGKSDRKKAPPRRQLLAAPGGNGEGSWKEIAGSLDARLIFVAAGPSVGEDDDYSDSE